MPNFSNYPAIACKTAQIWYNFYGMIAGNAKARFQNIFSERLCNAKYA